MKKKRVASATTAMSLRRSLSTKSSPARSCPWTMTTLNHDIPHLRVWVRDAFLHDLDPNQRGFTLGTAHAVCTIKGRALGFHVLLDNGAHIGRLPIHAL